MSVWEDVQDNPGTIPFMGQPVGMEIAGVDGADVLLNITAPNGFNDHLDFAARAVKFFDGELITAEDYIVSLRADSKAVSYALMFALRRDFMKL